MSEILRALSNFDFISLIVYNNIVKEITVRRGCSTIYNKKTAVKKAKYLYSYIFLRFSLKFY